MRSNASASPCCARRMASASPSSLTSVGLVRATGPVGTHLVLSMPSLLHKVVHHTTYPLRSGVLGSYAGSGEEQIVPVPLVPPSCGRPVPFWQELAQDADFDSVTAWDSAKSPSAERPAAPRWVVRRKTTSGQWSSREGWCSGRSQEPPTVSTAFARIQLHL